MNVHGRSADCFGQTLCEIPEAVQSDMSAKANDGRFAGAAPGSDLGQGYVGCLPRVLENPAGDTLLSPAQMGQSLFDMCQHVIKLQ